MFVDHGMMRFNEGEQVIAAFRDQFKVPLVAVDGEERFLNRLKGLSEPEAKRKAIGAEFIRVFEEEAAKIGDANYLVQGTLYSDVIESGGGTGAATIKSHHNVGGLPEDLQFELVEPLRALFKDEVRAVGAELGLPEKFVWRQPFPGPGLAIRVVGGEATKERLDTLRAADFILQDEIRKAGLYRELWQSFCVLPDIRTVGVQGDERTYGYVVAIRAVTSRRRHDRRLGAAALRPARADRVAHDQRDPRGQPRRARHHEQAAGHDRVGVEPEEKKPRRRSAWCSQPADRRRRLRGAVHRHVRPAHGLVPGRGQRHPRRRRRLPPAQRGRRAAQTTPSLGSMRMAVPLFDTATPLAPIDAEIRAKVNEVIDSKRFIFGPEVDAFEREFAAYIGTEHAVGVANGTDALLLALRALGRRTGRRGRVSVVHLLRLRRADRAARRDARSGATSTRRRSCSTAEHVREVLTPRTKAVIAVHLFGNVAPIAEIEALGVPVIEDAAQSAGTRSTDGRRPGALSATLATFSFFPSKNLGAFGDGGAVTTNSEALADRIKTLRFHGSKDKRTFELVGHNSRLDAIQAGILRVLLPHLDAWSDGRRAAARAYEEAGLGELVTLPVPTPGAEPAWHLYVVKSDRADELLPVLKDAGIGARRLLPRSDAPAAGAARVRAARPAAGHRGGVADEPRAPDEPGAHPRAGRRGRRRGRRARSRVAVALRPRPSGMARTA